jgi:tetratricopeptide (TPR) repeat protein
VQAHTLGSALRPRVRVVLPMAFGVAAAAALWHLPSLFAPPIDLVPYLPAPRPGSGIGERFRAWLDQGGGRPLVLPLLAAAAAGGLFLGLEALIRARLDRPNEVAALLPAVLWATLPGQTALHRLAGGESLLLAGAAAMAGFAMAGARSAVLALLGAGLAVSAVFAHPLALVLLPIAGLALAGRRGHGASLLLPVFMLLGLGIGLHLLAGGSLTADPVHPELDGARPRLALEQAAAAPILSADRSLRSLLATGFEGLRGEWPAALGLLFWLLLFGWTALLAGVRDASRVFAATAAALLAVPWLVPAWVPGERAALAIALLPAALAPALLLARAGSAHLRLVALGVSLGVALVGVDLHFDVLSAGRPDARVRMLESRRTALAPPRRRLPSGADASAPELERDPVRLLLHIEDIVATSPHGEDDPAVFAAGTAALARLDHDPRGVLDPATVRERLRARIRHPDAIPLSARPEERKLFPRLMPLEQQLAELRVRIQGEGILDGYATAVAELEPVIPDALEICLEGGSHPRFTAFGQVLLDVLRRLAEAADHLGEARDAASLREAVVELTARQPRAVALLGRSLLEAGRPAEALAALEEALPRLPAADPFTLIHRMALGAAEARTGDGRKGLATLQRAWADLTRGSLDGLLGWARPDTLEYWLIAEGLLVRYELVSGLDPGLEPQARHDLERFLDPAFAFGVRRVPALVLRGRLRALSGDVQGARQDLREFLGLRARSLRERVDGAEGRLDYPRFRRLGIETILGPADLGLAPEERARLESELAALAGR